jgi:hypothetical protein
VRRFLAVTGITAVLAFSSLSFARAQPGIAIDSTDAENDFPNGVSFSLSFHGETDLSDLKITFRYDIPPEGASTYQQPDCQGGTQVECTYNLKSGPDLFLVPGANINYYWEIDGSDGNTFKTSPATFVYDDTRFDWNSMTEGNLTVWYYAGSESNVRSLLQIGVDGLQSMEQLLNVQVTFPVKVFVYDSAEDMGPAALSNSDSPQDGVVTLGEVFLSDTAVVARDVRPEDVMRHELAHIVVREAVAGPFGDLPAWLSEGTAVYAQSAPLANEEEALAKAIKNDTLLSLHSMSSASFSHTSVDVSLFYGESWSIVSFLVDNYGHDKFAQLFATFKEGSTPDKAFQQVYGFDLDGLDAAWRQSLGLPPKETGNTGDDATPLPQLTPFDGKGNGSSNSDVASVPLALLISVGTAAVVVALAAGSLVVIRCRR